MSLPWLSSIAKFGARKYWVWVTFFCWIAPAKCPAIVLFLLSGVPNQFAFLLPAFRVSLAVSYFQGSWLFFVGMSKEKQLDTIFSRLEVECTFKREIVFGSYTSSFCGWKHMHSRGQIHHCNNSSQALLLWGGSITPCFFWRLMAGSITEAAGEDKGSTGDCFEKKKWSHSSATTCINIFS